MSLLADVQKFIELNHGVTAKELAATFSDYRRTAVQQAASRLYRCKRVNRRLHGKVFRYYAGKSRVVRVRPGQKRGSTAGRTGSGDPLVIEKLVSRAEELESRGLFNRASIVWLEAFSESQFIGEREEFLRRRQKCLNHIKKRTRPDEQIYLAGRFVGNVE
ncbi:TPA: PerC family transcriptional regulator [Salmonella enterica subsp. enterica]|nr:PerC family transcriptional regulator [Salmonella enterica]HCZ2200587.1 PerC family transcriptional regulator [Salmonella enterica subsp. enterica]HCZ2452955.1 PerC family transcriptional regulator [Salmonella enterica subsp. enterica]